MFVGTFADTNGRSPTSRSRSGKYRCQIVGRVILLTGPENTLRTKRKVLPEIAPASSERDGAVVRRRGIIHLVFFDWSPRQWRRREELLSGLKREDQRRKIRGAKRTSIHPFAGLRVAIA